MTQTPALYQYLKKYQQDPTSRVFAPLAESYRKAGLVDEAIEIAREGLRVHPGFVGGKVALARALFDKRQYQQVVEELSSVVENVPDNLAAQRLIAESYLMLGRVKDALGSYKMLLYFNPTDQEVARIVWELEAQAYEQGALSLRTDQEEKRLGDFNIRPVKSAIENDPSQLHQQWMQRIVALQGLLLKIERYRHERS